MVKLENPETLFSLRWSSNGRHFTFIFRQPHGFQLKITRRKYKSNKVTELNDK